MIRVVGGGLVCVVFGLLVGCSPVRTGHVGLTAGTVLPPVPRSVAKAQIPSDSDEGLHGDSPDDAAHFLRMQRWQGPGELPAERYQAAKLQARVRGKVSLAAGRRSLDGVTQKLDDATAGWQALGPGNIGGRVRALVIDPRNPAVIFAATATGGVWKSGDTGNTWAPLTDFLPVLSTTSLVMAPNDSNTLYLGTGEYQLWGNGIFKTADGGATWSQLAATDNIAASNHFRYVNQIAIPTGQPGHLYAATWSGLFVSLDAGTTWTQAVSAGKLTYDCTSVVAAGNQPADVVFAACRTNTSAGYNYSIYRNTDAAGVGTWDVVQSDPLMAETVLAVAPSLPTTIYALSVTTDNAGPFSRALDALFRSTSNGDAGTWTVRADTSQPASFAANILSRPTCFPTTEHNGQGSYNLTMAVDPTNPNAVFVGGIDIFRSDDGGATFGYANLGPNYGYAHNDQHALAFAPGYDGKTNQTLFLGNDGGVFRTDSALGTAPTGQYPQCTGGASGVSWISMNHGFEATQFYHGTVFPGGASYFGGAQDNGTNIGFTAGGVDGWGYLNGGDGGQVMVDPVDAATLFYESQHFGLVKSTDGGVTSTSATGGVGEPLNNFNFVTYFNYDPSDPLKMYAGAKQLWRTVDGALSWSAASAPVDGSQGGISVEAVDPNDSNTVYFGSNSGAWVNRSSNALTTDGTTTWAGVPLRQTGYISSIVFDPHLPSRVYATVATFRGQSNDAQVYRSDDKGATWVPLGVTGLQDIPVSTMVVDPDNSSTFYIGTDIGIFATYDGGVTWTQAAAPFADAVTTTLRIQYEGAAKVLYAFTFGRGVWKMSLNSAAPCVYSLSPASIHASADATEGVVTVTTAPGCPWSAQGGYATTVQSPASGVGTGPVYYKLGYNGQGSIFQDNIFVQGYVVPVTQTAVPTVPHSHANDEVATANVVGALPYEDQQDFNTFTTNAADPVHSCTGSADLATMWYSYSAAQAGNLSVNAASQFGDALVLTVYPLNGSAPGATLGKELACAVAPSQTFTQTTASAVFAATAGQQYAIEISLLTSSSASIQLDVSAAIGVAVTPQTAQVAPGATLQFTAAVTGNANAGVRWNVSPAQAGSISPTGLFTASSASASLPVTVIARSFADPQAIGAAAVNGSSPVPSFPANGLTNAASFQGGAVAPGEMVTVFGTSIGPAVFAGLHLDSTGKVATSTGNTQVTFDGVPAPMVYALSGQLTAIAPYSISGQATTQVVVIYNGQPSPEVTLPVTDTSPALFTSLASGTGQAAVVNQDYTINGPGHGAPAGSIVSLFGTGEGLTNPAGVDGQLAGGSVLPQPVASGIQVQIGGQNATVQYAGAAPGLVAGVFQINVSVPAGLTPGSQPVVVTIGANQSPANVTLTVR